MSYDDVNVHYLFAWLREYPQFRSHVVQRTLLTRRRRSTC